MATFGSIQGAEPSTVTFELRTVKINQNSTLMHQEIMSLGDPDTSNAIAAVLNAVPASTAWGLVTREAGGTLSSLGGIVVIQGNSTVAPLAGSTWNVRPVQSSAADLQMTATQGTNPWTIAGNSTVFPGAGSTWNVRPIQSSAGDLQATVTPVAGSTWRTQPGSTLWASSAGFHFDSSGAMLVVGSFSAQFSSTKADNLVTVYQSSAAELNASVQPIAGSTWRTQPGSTLWASSAGFHFDSSGALQTNGQLSGTVGLDFNTMQSSVAPSSGSSGLIVRQVVDNL